LRLATRTFSRRGRRGGLWLLGEDLDGLLGCSRLRRSLLVRILRRGGIVLGRRER